MKSFLKKLNVGYKEDDIDAVMIENTITPYIQEDETLNIDKWLKANGGVPLVSPIESIEAAGLSENPQQTLADVMSYQMAMMAAKNQKPEGTTE